MDEGQTEKTQGLPTGLSAKQQVAVRAMVRGKGVVATAKMVGVNRVTLYRWMQEPAFVAAMNRWRSAVFETARGQMVGILADAAQTVADRVRQGDGRLALAVLEKMGALGVPDRAGAGLDAETVARQMELDRRAGQIELDVLERQLTEAEQMNALLRQGRTPTVEELAEQHRQRQHEWDMEAAIKARQEEEAAAEKAAEAKRKGKAGADQPAGGGAANGERGGKSEPGTAAETAGRSSAQGEAPKGGAVSSAGVSEAVGATSDRPSTRMTMAEVEAHCAELTRRRGQPARRSVSSPPVVLPSPPPRPGSHGFIGPLPASFPPRLSGGLAPLYNGPPGPVEPEEPIDPMDDEFTEVWRANR